MGRPCPASCRAACTVLTACQHAGMFQGPVVGAGAEEPHGPTSSWFVQLQATYYDQIPEETAEKVGGTTGELPRAVDLQLPGQVQVPAAVPCAVPCAARAPPRACSAQSRAALHSAPPNRLCLPHLPAGQHDGHASGLVLHLCESSLFECQPRAPACFAAAAASGVATARVQLLPCLAVAAALLAMSHVDCACFAFIPIQATIQQGQAVLRLTLRFAKLPPQLCTVPCVLQIQDTIQKEKELLEQGYPDVSAAGAGGPGAPGEGVPPFAPGAPAARDCSWSYAGAAVLHLRHACCVCAAPTARW